MPLVTSGQDGGKEKHPSPPYTTTMKITTKLQNKYHPELSKIEVFGGPTTKDLKEPRSSRQVGGAEMHRCVET